MNLAEQFDAVDGLLVEARSLWEPAPFKLLELPWTDDHPQLVAALTALTDPELEALEDSPARARRFVARWLPRIADRTARVEPPALAAPITLDDTLLDGIPARKQEQIAAFVANLPALDLPILEWCSGKGHLARMLSHLSGQPARCVERDEHLAHAGRRIADERELPVDFAVLDALTHQAADQVQRDQLACALHACGELHVRLLELAVDAGTRAVAVSPCCYHLSASDHPRPLSTTARRSRIQLTRDQCRIALQESVTAAPAVRRRHRQLAGWRLGFDLLQREVRGVDEYLNVPSVPRGRVQSFAEFVDWAAERRGVELPGSVDLARWEAAGMQRLARVRRLTVVRHLFRRPIEMWLVLDRARYLEEAGYRVELGTFCERRVTPRNLLINAQRPAD